MFIWSSKLFNLNFPIKVKGFWGFGVFKGLKQTNIVMLGNFIAYWVIGIPLGFVLAFVYNMNLYGFWIGLTVSIFCLSMILLLILVKRFKQFKMRV